MRPTYANRLARELCADCGEKPLATRSRCEECRQEHNEAMREKRTVEKQHHDAV